MESKLLLLEGISSLPRHRLKQMPRVKLLLIVPEKTLQLESFAIEKSPLNSDVIARLKRTKTIDIRSPRVVRERNDDPLFGLIAYFKGAALEIHPLHPPIDGLDSASRLTRGAVSPGE